MSAYSAELSGVKTGHVQCGLVLDEPQPGLVRDSISTTSRSRPIICFMDHSSVDSAAIAAMGQVHRGLVLDELQPGLVRFSTSSTWRSRAAFLFIVDSFPPSRPPARLANLPDGADYGG